MNENKTMAENFIGLYPISKTLRFGLKPVGRTLEYMDRDGILETDEQRAENYEKVKEIIDDYHKVFIEESLQGLTLNGLSEFAELYYSARDEKKDESLKKCQENLRKQIAQQFHNHPQYKTLLNGKLISEVLPTYLKSSPEKSELVQGFANFTTYFNGFHSNRENMYSPEAKSTAIAYRVIHQNLPRYLDNIKVFSLIQKSEIAGILPELLKELQKKKDIDSIEAYFTVEGFIRTVTQSGIDAYNLILGAFSDGGGAKIKGLNEYINLYNQKIEKTGSKIPRLKPLYKQILSDREKLSFVPVQFENDQAVLQAVKNAYDFLCENVLSSTEGETIQNLLKNLATYNLSGIFISNDRFLTEISQQVYGDWSAIKNALSEEYDKTQPPSKRNKNREKYEEIKKKELNKIPYYSIQFLHDIMKEYGYEANITQYFGKEITETLAKLARHYDACKEILSGEGTLEKPLCKNRKGISEIKDLLDTMLSLTRIIKPFLPGKENPDKDENFYAELLRLNDCLNDIVPLYNRVRNYVTQKPYSLEKIKLNFHKTTFLAGWDKNKEKENLGIILLKDDLYYLGIMNRNSNKVMEQAPKAKTTDVYRKMEYKLLPGPNKMLPKVFFSDSRIDEFNPGSEIIEKYRKGTHKKGENFSLEDCHALIDFFKRAINQHEDWSAFQFNFSETKTYEDISGFYREVEHQGYKLTFQDIDASYIDDLVETGQLYLFQLSGKDFSPYSKGKPNLHTLYWKTLFDSENLKDVVYKLNGQAEVFYRKKSIEDADTVRHPANMPINNKYPNAVKKTSTFPYELIKDRRFTVEHFEFHVPITINFKAPGINSSEMNRAVLQSIYETNDLHIIGIDRGERNLLYLTVIDMQGNIKEQMSLNSILSQGKDNSTHEVNYHLLLDTKEKENLSARQNWQTVNTIAELKEGYLSQVVHVIAKLMIQYNAIVVLEDLNFGFKQGRQKVEKQVYQKFERMLIEKLNYLVDKECEKNEIGGAMRAYQLTAKFESFQQLGKQSGFLFYVPAWNTSKIDPTTGFTNLFYTKYESIEKTKSFINSFDAILYNGKENYFEFRFDYSRFTYKADGSRTEWTVCSNGNRIEAFRNSEKNNEWDTRVINLTEEFCRLFEAEGICWQQGDIRNALCAVNSADFYKSFLHLFSLMLQMRNSDAKTGEDKILSPVRNRRGEFFDSSAGNPALPVDADANGAYNIAKKGLWMVEQIKKNEPGQLTKTRLAISPKEWLAYAQEHTL